MQPMGTKEEGKFCIRSSHFPISETDGNRFWLNAVISHYQTYHTHYCLITTNSWDTELKIYQFFLSFLKKKQGLF